MAHLGGWGAFVAELDLDAQRDTDGFKIFAQRVDLGPVNATELDLRYPVLGDL
ncbi:hypothetical protein [Arthrobacter sp. lap29]|uniref:hypothetical protein n=1 Tax=Arthrobacter sp. lap29 TaxID=3056122 RepID=UPI0028F6CC04|nr:hypothetical protein [Arthrobacter sp. lap29]